MKTAHEYAMQRLQRLVLLMKKYPTIARRCLGVKR